MTALFLPCNFPSLASLLVDSHPVQIDRRNRRPRESLERTSRLAFLLPFSPRLVAMHPHVFTFSFSPCACTCRPSQQFSEDDADIADTSTLKLLESVAIFITQRAHERHRSDKIILREPGHPLVVIFLDATLLLFCGRRNGSQTQQNSRLLPKAADRKNLAPSTSSPLDVGRGRMATSFVLHCTLSSRDKSTVKASVRLSVFAEFMCRPVRSNYCQLFPLSSGDRTVNWASREVVVIDDAAQDIETIATCSLESLSTPAGKPIRPDYTHLRSNCAPPTAKGADPPAATYQPAANY